MKTINITLEPGTMVIRNDLVFWYNDDGQVFYDSCCHPNTTKIIQDRLDRMKKQWDAGSLYRTEDK